MKYSELKVKFVMHEDEVLALFPTEKFKHYGDSISCYAKIGQHGEASKSLLKGKRAKPDKYYPLFKELRSIYENSQTDGHCIILKID